jgi:Tol biopolymer transport system component/predicted Ser/Thr protein kinase
MASERWQQVERLYHLALEQEADSRVSFLARACEGDETLRQEVESLLAAAAGDDAFLEKPAVQVAAKDFAQDDLRWSMAGKTISHYRVIEKIGAGGMGSVYRASDTRLNREVAVKVLPSAFALEPDRMARFEREAQVLASLNHPGIAAIYGVEERALVMELVEGPTLAERIAQGPIRLEEALAIASQIADALEYAHEKGIVHRDLKPANVKVTPEGRVKVLDFGLAAVVRDPAASAAADLTDSSALAVSPTRTGMILGTAAYMSPEQARGSSVDKRADIWSFGALLYEMLAGKAAFVGETVTDILASVMKEQPDLVVLPAQVRTTVERCLSKDPRNRFGSIGDVRWALEMAQVGEGSTARGRARWLWPGIAAAALLAGAAHWLIDLWPKPPPVSTSFEIAPPAGQSITNAGLSPDGKKVGLIVTSPAERGPKLMIRAMDDPALRLVAGVEPEGFCWSPDSRKIAFCQGNWIKTVDLVSGSIQDLCSADSPIMDEWGANGIVLFTATVGDGKQQIFQVAAAGGTPQPLLPLDAARQETRQSDAQFLPNGKGILYTSTGGKEPGMYAASPDGSSRKLLKPNAAGSYVQYPLTGQSYLLFIDPNGTTLQQFDLSDRMLVGEPIPVSRMPVATRVFDVESSALLYMKRPVPLTRLAWFSRAGKEMETVGEPNSYNSHDVSPDGRRVVWEQLTEPNAYGDLWVKDMERGTRFRLTKDPGWEYWPHFWPDGSKVAFTWWRRQPSRYYLAVKPSNGSGSEEVVLESQTKIFLEDVSPDGAYLLYTQDRPLGTLWVLPLAGDRQPILYRKSEGDNRNGKFYRDGHWIVYASKDSGRSEIQVQDFHPGTARSPTGGDLTVVSSEGGSLPRWSPDGKELFYVGPDNTLMAVPVKTGSQFFAGRPEKLFRLPSTQGALYRLPYAPSADGRRFLIAASENGAPGSEVVVVVTNWMESLVK